MPAPTSSIPNDYIARVLAYPRLEREQEARLWHDWKQTGSPAACDQLIRANLRHVVTVAIKYRRYGVPLADLISEGNFGIVRALQKFEPERGLRFVTYALYWIRAHMLQHVIRSWSIVGTRGGALHSKVFFRLRRERTRIYNLLGESEQGQKELASRLNVPAERLAEYQQRLTLRDISLESATFDDHGTQLVSLLASHDKDQETGFIERQQQHVEAQALRRAIVTLDRRERFVLESTIFCEDCDALSLAEVGRRLGVSRERTRQLCQRALKKVRKHFQRTMEGDATWPLSA